MLQKIVNGIAIASGVVSITVVGVAGYVFIRKDAIIENVKSKVMESVLPGGLGGAIDLPTPEAPMAPPVGEGFGIPSFQRLSVYIYYRRIDPMAEAKKEEVKPKGPLGKLKETIDDKDEQMAFLSTIIRLAVLTWSAGILTLNYVKIPGYEQGEKIDPTFIASIFTGTLATFGVQAGGKKKDGSGGGGANISKKDMEILIEKAANTAPAQTIRIEQAPMVLAPQVPPKKG